MTGVAGFLTYRRQTSLSLHGFVAKLIEPQACVSFIVVDDGEAASCQRAQDVGM